VGVAIYPHQERVARLRTLLYLPGQVIPFALVPIGFPAETLPPADRFDAWRVHRDRS
jgi:hypothetical protein